MIYRVKLSVFRKYLADILRLAEREPVILQDYNREFLVILPMAEFSRPQEKDIRQLIEKKSKKFPQPDVPGISSKLSVG